MTFGLLGEHLGHSFSPNIHKALGGYDYSLFEVAPHQVAHFLHTEPFQGLNVTVPYKRTVMAHCAALTPAAQRIGSVNTIVRQPDGTLLGDNTDYDGFLYLLRQAGEDVFGKKALVLGSGGASRTVQTALADLGAREVVVISRSGPNHYQNLDRHADAQLIVNTTPVGMYPNTGISPVNLDQFPHCEGVYDLIYNPAKTQLLLDAEERSLRRNNGLGMLVAQARAAAERFLNQSIPEERVEEVMGQIANQTQNLLLIGMPGCGKSTVGQRLAQMLGRPLEDIDHRVEQVCGCTIPQLFEREGEAGFRAREHEMLCQVARESGRVIACGGGIVTRRENWAPMRQNSTVIYLKRELSRLPVSGRPLSQKHNLEELYRQRAPLYEQLADLVVENQGTPEETAAVIIRRLNR